MKLSAIQGVILRRMLVNFRVDPEVLRRHLPTGFQPKLHAGWGIAGVCLIRLEGMRPLGWPAFLGISSENAAHRFAVMWRDARGELREGVYIPRRDTDARWNQLAGGRLFPGEQHAASFTVREQGEAIDFAMASKDGKVAVELHGEAADVFPADSIFGTLPVASRFFQGGSLGYSATRLGAELEGMELVTAEWKVAPLAVRHAHSSFFADASQFPTGSVTFDCALMMRDVAHEWRGAPARPGDTTREGSA